MAQRIPGQRIYEQSPSAVIGANRRDDDDEEKKSPLGVSDDFTSVRKTDEPLSIAEIRAVQDQHDRNDVKGELSVTQPRGEGATITATPYWYKDDVESLDELSPEVLWQYQEAFVTAGLLTGKFRQGVADDPTRSAYRSLLETANRIGAGRDLAGTVEYLVQNPPKSAEEHMGQQEEEVYPGFLAPTRLEANPARIRENVQKFGRDQLGRDLSEEEVEHLAGTLESMERDDFDRMVEVKHDEHEWGKQAKLTGQPTTPPEREEFGAEVVASEFASYFKDRYAKQLEDLDRAEAGRAVSDLVLGGTSLASSMAGGI